LGENVSNPEEYDVVVLGSRVTVVDRNDALAHREDRDVSEALRGLFDDDRTSVNDNLPPNGYRTTVNTRQNGGIVSATSSLRIGWPDPGSPRTGQARAASVAFGCWVVDAAEPHCWIGGLCSTF
jgi:hypothetical protein